MLRRGSVGLLILTGLLSGCQNKPAPTPPPLQPVPTDHNAESARQQLQRSNPNAEVGTVVTVWHDLAAISDADVSKFNVGDPVSFLDGNLNDLTMGHVIKIVGTVLQVQFDPPTAGHREPQKGDLAVSLTTPLVRPTRPAGETPAPELAPRRRPRPRRRRKPRQPRPRRPPSHRQLPRRPSLRPPLLRRPRLPHLLRPPNRRPQPVRRQRNPPLLQPRRPPMPRPPKRSRI